jgi:hypothetical protein
MFSIVVLLKKLDAEPPEPHQNFDPESEPRKIDVAMELLVPFWNMFFMLNISSKQELLEPHRLTAPAPPDDVARCGSSFCIVNTAFSLFSL